MRAGKGSSRQYFYGHRTDQVDNNWRTITQDHETLQIVAGYCLKFVQGRTAILVHRRGDRPGGVQHAARSQRSTQPRAASSPTFSLSTRFTAEKSMGKELSLVSTSLSHRRTFSMKAQHILTPGFPRENVAVNGNWPKPCCAIRIISFHRHTCLKNVDWRTFSL